MDTFPTGKKAKILLTEATLEQLVKAFRNYVKFYPESTNKSFGTEILRIVYKITAIKSTMLAHAGCLAYIYTLHLWNQMFKLTSLINLSVPIRRLSFRQLLKRMLRGTNWPHTTGHDWTHKWNKTSEFLDYQIGGIGCQNRAQLCSSGKANT